MTWGVLQQSCKGRQIGGELMIKPSPGDKKAPILIAGEELSELKRMTWQMADALDSTAESTSTKGSEPLRFIAGTWSVFWLS